MHHNLLKLDDVSHVVGHGTVADYMKDPRFLASTAELPQLYRWPTDKTPPLPDDPVVMPGHASASMTDLICGIVLRKRAPTWWLLALIPAKIFLGLLVTAIAWTFYAGLGTVDPFTRTDYPIAAWRAQWNSCGGLLRPLGDFSMPAWLRVSAVPRNPREAPTLI